jgi:hypothetical protein
MTAISEEPFTDDPSTETQDETASHTGLAARILVPTMWGTLAIGMMWLAVIFVAASDAQFTSTDASGGSTTVPTVIFVAFFAFLGSVSVAKRVYGSKK